MLSSVGRLVSLDVCERANEEGVFKAMAFVGGTVICTRYDRSEDLATLQALQFARERLINELERIDHDIASVELSIIKKEEE